MFCKAFLYRRSIIVEHKTISLREDALLNCRFFCYAKKLSRIDDILYMFLEELWSYVKPKRSCL